MEKWGLSERPRKQTTSKSLWQTAAGSGSGSKAVVANGGDSARTSAHSDPDSDSEELRLQKELQLFIARHGGGKIGIDHIPDEEWQNELKFFEIKMERERRKSMSTQTSPLTSPRGSMRQAQ
eukprot:2359784-Rhodomonas_salina.1